MSGREGRRQCRFAGRRRDEKGCRCAASLCGGDNRQEVAFFQRAAGTCLHLSDWR